MNHTAAYIRVSTKEQDPYNQLPEIKRLAEARGFTIEKVYEDRYSGGAENRPAFQAMMEDVRKGQINLLLFWSMDRFSRRGTSETLADLRQLDMYGCRFLSVQEQYLDTLGPFREAVIGILAAVARMERERHVERVRAGVERARERGVHLGRPRVQLDEGALRRMKQEGWGLREMARALNASPATVKARLGELGG